MRRPNLISAFLTLVLLTGCAKVYHVASEDVSSYRINKKTSDVGDNSKIEQMIQPYRAELASEMSEVISLAAEPFSKGDRDDPESTLGNWVADAILAQAKLITRKPLDFGICNSGGIRVNGLPAGPLTRGHFYELMPFDNYLVTMRLPGEVIRQLFDRMAASGGWPISAGVSYKIKGGKAQQVMIQGAPLDLARTYEIALSDYLAEGGGALDFLKEYDYENLQIYYRDAMIEQALMMKGIGKSLDARLEGRVENLDQ
ncbi:MAG: 5'-nucleotidase C-terminal domain-containing protein [Saprospiraceae bacterium]|nr:5'-nucleotidase C-terminal domain-containing protein [Saprospiraceae bacterium]